MGVLNFHPPKSKVRTPPRDHYHLILPYCTIPYTLTTHTQEQNRKRVSLPPLVPATGWHWGGEAAFNSLGAGRVGDPSQPPRKKWGSPTFSAYPPYEAKQMLDPTLTLG